MGLILFLTCCYLRIQQINHIEYLYLPPISLQTKHFWIIMENFQDIIKLCQRINNFLLKIIAFASVNIYRCSFVHRQNIHKNVLSKLPPINILTDMTRKLILFYMYLQVSKIKAYCIFEVFCSTSNNRNTFL